MAIKLRVEGASPCSSLFLLILISFFIVVSSLKINQINDELSIKFASVTMNIGNSLKAVAVFFFNFFFASFQCELKPGR